MSEIKRIGLVAGRGQMPLEVIKSCHDRGIEVFVLCLIPFANPQDFAGLPIIQLRMGEAGKALKWLRENDITDMVMSGGVDRPSIKELIPDWEGLKILTKIALKRAGDDTLFKSLISEFNARGINIRGIQDVAPQMLFNDGVYGKISPTEDDWADIHRGIEVAKALGGVDVGQSVSVQDGIVLALEAAEGTDRMIERAGTIKRKGKKPIVVKIKKPGQDTRTDLPAIGMLTIAHLHKNGMGGIAVQAGAILLIEQEKVIAEANRLGIFIVGINL